MDPWEYPGGEVSAIVPGIGEAQSMFGRKGSGSPIMVGECGAGGSCGARYECIISAATGDWMFGTAVPKYATRDSTTLSSHLCSNDSTGTQYENEMLMLKVSEDFPLHPGNLEVTLNRRNNVVNYSAIDRGLIQNVSGSEEIIMREK
jgi:hypothetical protein